MYPGQWISSARQTLWRADEIPIDVPQRPRPEGSSFYLLFFYLQIIRNRKYVGNAVCYHVCRILIGLRGNDAFKRHVSVADDYIDRRHALYCIHLKIGSRIDGPIFSTPDLFVHGRGGKYLI